MGSSLMQKKLAVLGFALGLLGAACGQTTESGDSVSTELAALENPVVSCQTEAADCAAAATTRDEYQACSDSFRGCLDGAAMQGQQAAEALQDCRDAARDCVIQGGSLSTCRADYDACVGSLVPSGGAGGIGGGLPGLPTAGTGGAGGIGGGLPSLPTAGTGGGLPSLPGLPTLPGLPGLPTAGSGGAGGIGGGLPSLPSLPGSACMQGLRDCVGNGGTPSDCASDARDCLRAALMTP